MRYTATIRLGAVPITVAAETLHELLQELQHVRDLDAAREGVEDAVPMYREWDGFRYYGLRRADGAEVLFGQHKEAEKRGRVLYAYSPTSEGYRGWQRYDHERGERVPADVETRATPHAAEVPEANPAEAEHRAVLAFIRDTRARVGREHRAHIRLPRGRSSRVLLHAYIGDAWEQIKADQTLARSVADAVTEATGVRRG